jgi:hypothetical protein
VFPIEKNDVLKTKVSHSLLLCSLNLHSSEEQGPITKKAVTHRPVGCTDVQLSSHAHSTLSPDACVAFTIFSLLCYTMTAPLTRCGPHFVDEEM